MNGVGAEREGNTESETNSRLWAVGTEPDAGLKLTDCEIMTWAKVRRLTDWATQAPLTLGTFSDESVLTKSEKLKYPIKHSAQATKKPLHLLSYHSASCTGPGSLRKINLRLHLFTHCILSNRGYLLILKDH